VTLSLPGARTAAALAGLLAGLLISGAPLRAAAPTAPADPADLTAGYHRFSEVERQLQAWSREHPELQVQTIGKSAGGRPIYVARLGAGDDQPAVFVGANAVGWHNAGTEAALHLIARLLSDKNAADLLRRRTFYVAPILDPDACDAFFAKPRARRSGNGQKIDRDRDGFEAEDPADDLDGDGVITRLRIPDPAGGWLPDAADPRALIKADALEQRAGAFRVESEGKDDDGDGTFNEDGADGVQPDHNFPHAFPYPDPEAGPWASFAPETRAAMDFILARRNIALAVVYGPANNFLAAPQSLGGGGGDLGTQTFKVPPDAAKALGFDPEQEYTLDQVWEVAKDNSFVRQNGITKEQLGQYLGAGAATKVDAGDQAYLDKLAEAYKERLKKAGLSADRPAEQYAKGGLTPWLYYQVGAFALELDVWGVPKAEKKADAAATAGGGGGGAAADGGKKAAGNERERDILAWVDAHAPQAFHAWKPVTLPDGTKAEAGGLDPFITVAPPQDILKPALEAHTETVLDLASKLAQVAIVSLRAQSVGGGVWRVRAVAGNRGWLATHTKMAERGRFHLPVRLEIETGKGIELVTGRPTVTAERLEGTSGTLAGEWLVRAEPGARISVQVLTDNAGRDEKTVTLGKVS
jgi:hypothetical protein